VNQEVIDVWFGKYTPNDLISVLSDGNASKKLGWFATVFLQ